MSKSTSVEVRRDFGLAIKRQADSPFFDAVVWFLAIVAGAAVQASPAIGIPLSLLGGFAYYWLKRASRESRPHIAGLLRSDALAIVRLAAQKADGRVRNIALWRPAAAGHLSLFCYASLSGLPAEGRSAIVADPKCSIWCAFDLAQLYEERAPAGSGQESSRQAQVTKSGFDWSVRYAFPLCDVEDGVRVVGILSFECDEALEEKVPGVKEVVTVLAVAVKPALEGILSSLVVFAHD